MNGESRSQTEFQALPKTYDFLKIGIALLFIVCVMSYVITAFEAREGSLVLVIAAVIGGYMALNIGANDVANNIGPAVGSKALTMFGAISIAAVFESAGAIIAGGDVVGTIKKGIIDPALINDADPFIWLMMAALLAGAIWLNIATYLGAPVSTTHSIVGGVLGAGIAAGGLGIANWPAFGRIAASWVISPLMGALIAALFLYLIKRLITYQDDMLQAARKYVPILIALMACVFVTYILLKGLKKICEIELTSATAIGFVVATGIYALARPCIAKVAQNLANSKTGVNSLFTSPLIFSAAMLSFAHGANDVANAVGPLAAINDAFFHSAVTGKAPIPLWVMLVGAIGIVLGLALYGPKLIRTVGVEITELDKIRAFCVAMAAAITVIIASQLGLPVSSTHTAVGAIFGVGFLREYLKNSYARTIEDIKFHYPKTSPDRVDAFLIEFNAASIKTKAKMLKELKKNSSKKLLDKKERKRLKKAYGQELVKRSQFYKITMAWIITVPASGLLAAILYFSIRGYMLP